MLSRPIWLFLVAGIVLQAILISYTFPVTELLDGRPLFYVDNAYHWYSLAMAKHLFAQGSSIIYDPHFNAGIPYAFSADPSANPAVLLIALFGDSLSGIQAWKLYVFFASVITPLLPALGFVALGFRVAEVALGLLLGLLLWWVSWFHYFTDHGMVSWVVGCFTALWVVCLFLAHRDNPTLRNALVTGVAGAIMVFIHPLTVLPVFVIISAYLLFNYHKLLDWRFMVYLTGFAFLSVALNAWWLLDQFSPAFAKGFDIVSYQARVKPRSLVTDMLGIWGKHMHGSKTYPLLILLSLVALVRLPREEARVWVYPFLLAWAVLQVYAAFAGAVPLLAKMTEPNRHAPAGYLLLLVPAIRSISLLAWHDRAGWTRRVQFAGYVLATPIVLYCMYELVREATSGKHGRYASAPPSVAALGADTEFVLATLQEQTDRSARVLFETSKGRVHDGGHLAGYYAYQSNREFIGGPYTYRYFAGYWDGFVFGRPIDQLASADFLEYLEIYNIGWILAHSDESKAYLEKFDGIHAQVSHRELTFYRVDRAHSFFAEGAGRVNATRDNRIELHDLEGSKVVLKYHYIPGLVSDPQVEIEPTFLKDDPLPFIQLNNPPANLVLSLTKGGLP